MSISTKVRRTLATVAAAALVITGTLSTASAANASIDPPSVTKMAALGDSITQAVNSCSSWSGCAQYSWSTGTNVGVPSHLRMIDQANGATAAPAAYNYSVSGAKSTTLVTQAGRLTGAAAVNYVTIEIGANDACTRTPGEMTSVDQYRANIVSALEVLKTQGGNPRVFIASVPSLQQLWSVNSGNSSARFTWGLLKICQSMLLNPTSTNKVDVDRRTFVQQRVNDYNSVLAGLCAPLTGPYNCQYDGGAVATTQFLRTDISTRDYFHPSFNGQVKLADVTWRALQAVPWPH